MLSLASLGRIVGNLKAELDICWLDSLRGLRGCKGGRNRSDSVISRFPRIRLAWKSVTLDRRGETTINARPGRIFINKIAIAYELKEGKML